MQLLAFTRIKTFHVPHLADLHVQVRALRQVSAGQGLMLESSSRRLMQPGMPHHNCPDKVSKFLGTYPQPLIHPRD